MRAAAFTGRRPALPFARPAVSACLIAVVAALAMVGQGDLTAPPRYDGAGYAVLARSLAAGTGYRAIDQPDRPGHAHFPPGYPVLLAFVWSVTGPSALAAHLVSCFCTVGATLAAWWWFRGIYSRDTALVLGLVLALNWAWARTGSAIQSEPLYMLLSQVTIVAAVRAAARGGVGQSLALGGLLAACLLTRQIAIGLVLAVLLDLCLRRRWSMALSAAVVSALVISPWLVWLVVVGGEQRTQADLLLAGSSGLPGRIVSQALFYLQRIPDQITGPVVEVATVIRRTAGVERLANLWALVFSGVVIAGWLVAVRRPRRRLAGLIPMMTLALLLIWPYTEAGRFLIPLVPCLLIGAVEGMSGLVRWGKRSFGLGIPDRRVSFFAAVLILVVSLPYSGYSLITGRARARDAGNRAFDAACAWLAWHGDRPGPILTRHPGEVFLATGRQALEVSTSERQGEADASPDAIARTIARHRVAYLLIDEDRYLSAPSGPLGRFVAEHPQGVRKVWSSEPEGPAVAIYEVLPEHRAGAAGLVEPTSLTRRSFLRSGPFESQRPVVLVAMEAQFHDKRSVWWTGRIAARGITPGQRQPRGRRPVMSAEDRGDPRASQSGCPRPGAHHWSEGMESYPTIACSDSRAAAIVWSMSASVCAAETKAASN